jgi:phosphoglycerate dehydrogenase-like enzyme
MEKKPRVLLTHPAYEIGTVFQREAYELLQKSVEVIQNPYPRRLTGDEAADIAQDVEGIIAEWYTRLNNRLFDKAKLLKVVALCAEGSTNLDLEAATCNGVIVANVPEMYMEPLVSLVECYLLCLATGIMQQHQTLRDKGEIIRQPWIELKGKTLGLIGLGRLGQRLAMMGAYHGLRVIAYDPFVTRPHCSAELVSLEKLLTESRFIIISCSWTSETTHLIGKREIELMREDAFLINPGRGAIVDEAELAKALHDRRIAGAAVDVYSEEHDRDGRLKSPPIVHGNPLLTAPNVITTPHIGGHTTESYLGESIGAVNAVLAVLSGSLPDHIVNPEVFKFMPNSDRWNSR